MLLVDGRSVMHGCGRPVPLGRILMRPGNRVTSPHRRLLVRGGTAPVRVPGVAVSLGGGVVGPLRACSRLPRP